MLGPCFGDRWQRFLLYGTIVSLATGSLIFYLGASLETHLHVQLVLIPSFCLVSALVVLIRALRRRSAGGELRRRVPHARTLWLVYPPVLSEGRGLARRQAAAYEHEMPGALGVAGREVVFLALKKPLIRGYFGRLLGFVVGNLAHLRSGLLQQPPVQRWNRSAVEAVLAIPSPDLRMWFAGLKRLRLQLKGGTSVDFACIGADRLAEQLRRELAVELTANVR